MKLFNGFPFINLLSFCKDPKRECFFFLLHHFTGQLEQKNKTDCGIFPAVGGLEGQPQGREVSKTGTLVSEPSRIPCLGTKVIPMAIDFSGTLLKSQISLQAKEKSQSRHTCYMLD